MGFYLSVPGEMTTEDAKRFVLMYLFLSADHAIAEDEMKWFSSIGNNHEGWDAAKDSIIKKAEDILAGNGNVNRYDKIMKTFDEIADGYSEIDHRLCLMFFSIILYRDGMFSEERLKLARHWVEYCKIDQSIFDEMQDCANTSVVLRKQKERIARSFPWDISRCDMILSEIDKNQKEIDESLSSLAALG
jgi:hypothetical protein